MIRNDLYAALLVAATQANAIDVGIVDTVSGAWVDPATQVELDSHAVLTEVHGISAFGAALVNDTDASGSLNFATTGSLLGAVNVNPKTAATYTVGTDDSNESYGTLFVNADNDAIGFVLPSAVSGMSTCFMQGQGVVGAISVLPAAGDYLVVDGVRGTVATSYGSAGSGEDQLCAIAIDATDWIITTSMGTWSE